MKRFGVGTFSVMGLLVVLVSACGGGGGGHKENSVTPTQTVVVSIDPQTSNLSLGATQQFQARVTGNTNTAVTWSVSGGGVISQQGLYTAPMQAGSATITATSNADATKSASATVTINASTPTIEVGISPTTATLALNATQQFIANVVGTDNTAVTWAATGAGSVSSSGLFTAANTPGSATVTATSVADNSRHASATILISAGVDTTAPSIVSRVPTANAASVDPTQAISITFSESIVSNGLVVLLRNGNTAINFTQQIQSNTLTITPQIVPGLTGSMTLVIEGARDVAGNIMNTTEWSWTLRQNSGDDLATNGFTGQDFPNLREALTTANCDAAHPDNANFSTNIVNVGPGQAVTDLSQVAWESLPAHTMVRVHPKATPYNERIFIVRSDIKVCGIRDANGKRPTINGLNATVRNNSTLQNTIDIPAHDYATVNRGIVAIYGNSGIKNIVIEGLDLTGTMSSPYSGSNHAASYRGMDGQLHLYNTHTGCIYVARAQNITIRDNEISFCPSGVFVLSKGFNELGDDASTMVRNFLLEGNYLHDNGLVDDYNVHQAYIQGVNFVVQYNFFGNPIRYDVDGDGTIEPNEASNGNNIKMRTVGDLIRYNYFENGAHAIDLIDIEDFRPSVFPWFFNRVADTNPSMVTPALRTMMERDWLKFEHGSYVYGNIFRRDEKVHRQTQGASMLHFGSDNSPVDARRGKVWFYFNTIVTGINKNNEGAVTLFSCCLDNSNSYSYYPNNSLQLNAQRTEFHYVVDGRDYGVVRRRTAEEFYPRYVAVNNAVQVLSATNMLSNAHPFHWNTYLGEQVELRRNFITSNWNQPLYGGYPTPGYGDNVVAIDDFSYPGAQDHHHVSGVENLQTSASLALDSFTAAPVVNSPVCGQALAWSDDIPLAVRPNYQIRLESVSGGEITRGKLVIGGRESHSSIGASQCN